MISHCPAQHNFNLRLKEIETLLGLCENENASLREKSNSRQTDGTLCRAALVLLCSHMEGFFEDLIENIMRFHSMNTTLTSCLPMRLRIKQIWKYLDAVNAASDDKKWEAIQMVRSSPIANMRGRCKADTLSFDLHVKGFSTPGSKDVERLFHSIGIDDIWSLIEAKRPGSAIYRRSLDALVHRPPPNCSWRCGRVRYPKRCTAIYL